MKKITKETLRKWNACAAEYKRFCELMPKGDYLKEASEKLINDGHSDLSNWLWEKCKTDNDYTEQTVITAGDGGTATAGDGGIITILYYNLEKNCYIRKSADIDGVNYRPKKPYHIVNGELVIKESK